MRELTPEVLNAIYEAGCGDALICIRGDLAYADFCREADSLPKAVSSAVRNVEAAGFRATWEG